MSKKSCARYFKIRKFAFFLIFEKAMSKIITLGILRFVSMLFLIFEKAMDKKTALGILRFVSMFLFNI